MGLPPMEMDVWWSWHVSCMIVSWNKLNRTGVSKQPWQTPTVVLKNSPSWLFKRTALLEFSYSAWTTWSSPSSMLKLLMPCHRPASQTLSNVFLKPLWSCGTDHTGVEGSSLWWLDYLQICSTVLWPGLKPAFPLPANTSLGIQPVEDKSHDLAEMAG